MSKGSVIRCDRMLLPVTFYSYPFTSPTLQPTCPHLHHLPTYLSSLQPAIHPLSSIFLSVYPPSLAHLTTQISLYPSLLLSIHPPTLPFYLFLLNPKATPVSGAKQALSSHSAIPLASRAGRGAGGSWGLPRDKGLTTLQMSTTAAQYSGLWALFSHTFCPKLPSTTAAGRRVGSHWSALAVVTSSIRRGLCG